MEIRRIGRLLELRLSHAAMIVDRYIRCFHPAASYIFSFGFEYSYRGSRTGLRCLRGMMNVVGCNVILTRTLEII